MSALAATQAAFAGWVLRGEGGLAPRIAGDRTEDRLRIYADAYRLRLAGVLGDDFPRTRAVLGDEVFATLAGGYLRAHPSRQPSVRHFGAAFADWLGLQADLPPGLHELARFEWRQGECFDAAEARSLHINDVARLPAAGWPQLPLRLRPCVRLLSTRWLAVRDGAPAPADAEAPACWLLWRSGFEVHWRCLDADEAEALGAAQAGVAFGALCERLARHHGEAGAARAAALLKRWLADGLLASPDPTT